MARGKAAAQAANRRLAEAQERIAELEQRAAEREALHRAELERFRAETDRARSALCHEVDARTAEVVRETQENATLRIAELREGFDRRIRNGLNWIYAALGDHLPRDLEGCARAFEIQVSDVIAMGGDAAGELNRASRRTSTKSLRAKHSLRREIALAGPSDVLLMGGGSVIMPESGLPIPGNMPVTKRAPR